LTNAKFGIHLFNFFFVEYTYARSPHDYCNNIDSPPERIIFLNENGQLEETGKLYYNRSSSNQETYFDSDPKDQFTSSSGKNKSNQDFNLNELPPGEDE